MFLTIGISLITLSFWGNSKLNKTCTSKTSKTLRQYLKLCIGSGAIHTSISFMYLLCGGKGNNCDDDIDSDKKIYITTAIMIFMGILLMIFSVGISKELKSDNCKIELGYLPHTLIGFASFQIFLGVLLIFLTMTSKKEVVSSEKTNSNLISSKKEVSSEKTNSNLISSKKFDIARKSALDAERRTKIETHIADLDAKLSELKREEEDYEIRGKNIPTKIKAKLIKLNTDLNDFKRRLNTIQSPSSSSSGSSIGSSIGSSSGSSIGSSSSSITPIGPSIFDEP